MRIDGTGRPKCELQTQRRLAFLIFFLWSIGRGWAGEAWQTALESMPLPAGVKQLNATNCVSLLLESFQSNHIVKALVFMPGATDEFYMFHRARAALTNQNPSLLDAVEALTHSTLIRATFQPPLLLLHTDEDPLDGAVLARSEACRERLVSKQCPGRLLMIDRDWDSLQPVLKRELSARVYPWVKTYDSWHFYRHSFAGWNLNGFELLQAVTAAGKTRCSAGLRFGLLGKSLNLHFEGDERIRHRAKF